MKTNRSLSLCALAMCATFLGACASYAPREVQLQVDPALAGASIQVDVIGASKEKKPTLDATPVGQYWQSAALRQTLGARSFRFGGGGAQTQTLSIHDPAWSRWGKAEELVVLADLPGVFNDAGAGDPRRLTVPLTGGGPVKVQIQASGLVQLP